MFDEEKKDSGEKSGNQIRPFLRNYHADKDDKATYEERNNS